MPAAIDLINMALYRLGEPPLTSLDEGSAVAEACAHLYPTARDRLLQAHPWPFATVRQRLARLTATPASDYAYYYALPTDPACLQVLSVDLAQQGQEYARELYVDPLDPTAQQPVLATDASAVTLTYLGRVQEAVWPPAFADAVALALAVDLTAVLTGKASLRKELADALAAQLTLLAQQAGREALPRRLPAVDDEAEPARALVVDICNAALLRLGLPMTAGFADAPAVAQALVRLYPGVRDALLSEHTWPFATVRQVLERLEATPASDYAYYYALPAEPAVLRVIDLEADNRRLDYQREVYVDPELGPLGVLATNAASAVLRYVGRVDERAYPPLFRDALALKLAVEASALVPEKAGLSARLREDFERQYLRLVTVAGQEDAPAVMPLPTTYVDVRGDPSTAAPTRYDW